jgi:Do/DeqQ family serine protease
MNVLKSFVLPACITASLAIVPVGVFAADDVKPAAPPATNNFLQQLNDSFSGIYEKAVPSVVIIDTIKKETADDEEDMQGFEFFFRGPQGQGNPQAHPPVEARRTEGSGFFIRPDGYILTNNHVIEGADKITVRLKDGRHFTGKVIGTDESDDIAVVKIDANNMPVLQFADSDAVKVGQMICSIGTPFEFEYSFAFGWVSGKGRANLPGEADEGKGYEDFLQTDSFVNPGDSGGPVLDINGRVVGMNTLINGLGRKMTFAIPSNMLQQVSNELIADGKIVRSWLGVRIANVDDELPRDLQVKGIDHGAEVIEVEGGGPASHSDLRVPDVITAVDGRPVTSAHDLQGEIRDKKVGSNVKLTVWRDGKSVDVAIVTSAMPSLTEVVNNNVPKPEVKPPTHEKANPGATKDAGDYGFKVHDLNKDLADKLNLKDDAHGVVVTDVTAKSAAAAAGVQKDDVITEVDSQPVDSASTFKTLVDQHDSDKGLLLFINRKGQKTYAIVKPE